MQEEPLGEASKGKGGLDRMGVWGSDGPQLVFFSYDRPILKSPLSKQPGRPPVRDGSGLSVQMSTLTSQHGAGCLCALDLLGPFSDSS